MQEWLEVRTVRRKRLRITSQLTSRVDKVGTEEADRGAGDGDDRLVFDR